MFTGIIEEKGKFVLIEKGKNVNKITIRTTLVEKVNESDSISIDGICLTVVGKKKDDVIVEAIKDTYELTTLQYKKEGDIVNIETSLKVDKFLGGHIVLGHIDTIAKVIDIKMMGEYATHFYEIKEEFNKFIISKGSIAINGVSLTISEVNRNIFCVNIIPFTLTATNLGLLKRDDYVNVEFDIIGKYIYNFIKELSKDLSNKNREEKLRLFLEDK